MTTEQREYALILARKYGCANCWTCATGELACYLLAALKEIERLEQTVQSYQICEQIEEQGRIINSSSRN